jgi:hypothetical protein
MDPVKVRKVNMSDFLESMKRIKKSIASDNLGKLATYTVKKVRIFPSPRMSLTNLSLAGSNLFIPAQGEIGKFGSKLSLAGNNLINPAQGEFGK